MSMILSTKNLYYKFDNEESHFLNDINIEIKEHKFTAIIGANGSGKSTLFRLLSGISKASEGYVFLKGKKLLDTPKEIRSKTMAIIQQKNQMEARLTVREIVEFGRIPYSSKKFGFSIGENDKKIIDTVLNQVGISDISNRYFNELSGGQQQRVWLALALVQEPEIILLDEPTNHLDVLYQLELLELLKNMVNNKEITVCAILHDINHVLKYSDEVIVMKDGKVLESGVTGNILTPELIYDAFKVGSTKLRTCENQCVLDFYLTGGVND